MIQEFHRPATMQEAISLKARLEKSAVFLAGGTEINARSARGRAVSVISLDRLGLDEITDPVGELRLGATATLQALLDSPLVPAALKEAASHVANRNIREMATLGGNLASRRACSALIPALVVLEAQLLLHRLDRGCRASVQEYLAGETDDLIVCLLLARSDLDRRCAVRRFARTANGPTILSVAVSYGGSPSAIERPIIVVGGAGGPGERALRLEEVERRLHGRPLPPRDDVEAWVKEGLHPPADARGGSELKRQVAAALVGDCLVRAGKRG